MKPKINMKKLIREIKGKGSEPKESSPKPLRLDIDYTKPTIRHRDMRQEAMDMGSHGAKDIWESTK